MISVLLPTNRIGGLDLLFDSLERQTHRDFELVLVDNIYKHRRELVAERARGYSFQVRHIPPRDDTFPAQGYVQTVNTGIAHARGETIVLLCDYSWLHEDCLATHARLQELRRAPITLDYKYTDLPPLKPGLPLYVQTANPTDEASNRAYVEEVNAESDRYAADVRSGKLNDYMWSIFDEPQTAESLAALKVTHSHTPCATAKLDEDWNWCSFKNESFPTELFLDMNGVDEAYDSSHVYQDSEFSYRLKARGIRWFGGEPGEGLVTVVNPRPIMNIKRLANPITHNARLCFEERRAEFGMPVNPGFSLRDWRERVLRS